MKRIKIILGYLLGVISSIVLVLLICLLVIKSTVLNKDYVRNTLQDNHYYEIVFNEIEDEMKDYITSSGFENDILKDIYSYEEVVIDIDLFVDNAFKSQTIKLDKQNILEKLDTNINKILKESNLEVINKENITSFEDDIVNIYKNEITLYNMADGIIVKYDNINNLVNKGMIILGILLIINLVLMIIIKKIKYLGAIIMATDLMMMFLHIAVYENIDVDNLLIITTYFSSILTVITKYIGSLLLKVGAISLIIGVIISLTLSCQGKRNKC